MANSGGGSRSRVGAGRSGTSRAPQSHVESAPLSRVRVDRRDVAAPAFVMSRWQPSLQPQPPIAHHIRAVRSISPHRNGPDRRTITHSYHIKSYTVLYIQLCLLYSLQYSILSRREEYFSQRGGCDAHNAL